MSSYNTNKKTKIKKVKNDSGISYVNTEISEQSVTNNNPEYEYEEVRVSNSLRNKTSNTSEYEYEDGTIKNRIKTVNKKKRSQNRSTKKYVKLSSEKKAAYGYKAPSSFFDLSDWSLSVPEDRDGNRRADNIEEKELSSGYILSLIHI